MKHILWLTVFFVSVQHPCYAEPFSESPPTRLTRTYKNQDNFLFIPVNQTRTVGSWHMTQAKYAGRYIRPDDTVAYRLARILQLGNLQSKPIPPIYLRIADARMPLLPVLEAAKNSPASSNDYLYCFWIGKESSQSKQQDQSALFFASEACTSATAKIIVHHPALDSTATRSLMKDGKLNEIGHRIASEEIFLHLHQQLPQIMRTADLAYFKQRRNIFPKNNERLASLPQPDS